MNQVHGEIKVESFANSLIWFVLFNDHVNVEGYVIGSLEDLSNNW